MLRCGKQRCQTIEIQPEKRGKEEQQLQDKTKTLNLEHNMIYGIQKTPQTPTNWRHLLGYL